MAGSVPPRPSVFLSYGRADALEPASRIERDLQEKGFRVFRDVVTLPPGVRWRSELQREIDESDAFLLLLSPHAVTSDHCQSELDYALDRRKRVLPVLVERCELPMEVVGLHYIDLERWRDRDRYQEGLAEICRHLEPEAVSSPHAHEDASADTLLSRDLFRHDPLLFALITGYESDRARYAAVALFFMILLPLLVAALADRAGFAWPFTNAAFLALFVAIFGLGPVAGSWAAHMWLTRLAQVPAELFRANVLSRSAADSYRSALLGAAARPRLTVTALAALAAVAWWASAGDPDAPWHAWLTIWARRDWLVAIGARAYMLLICSVWWYAILKVALVLGAVLGVTRRVLLADTTAARIDGRLMGFDHIGRLSFAFLVFYVLVVGAYLTGSLAFEYSVTNRILATIHFLQLIVLLVAAYVAIPLYWIYAVLWPSHVKMRDAKRAELGRLAAQERGLLEEQRRGGRVAAAALRLVAERRSEVERQPEWPVRPVRMGVIFMMNGAMFGFNVALLTVVLRR